MKTKTKTIIQTIALIALVILGVAYAIHKGENEKRYSEINHCKWVAQGGLNICK